jgi:hypothetical protein
MLMHNAQNRFHAYPAPTHVQGQSAPTGAAASGTKSKMSREDGASMGPSHRQSSPPKGATGTSPSSSPAGPLVKSEPHSQMIHPGFRSGHSHEIMRPGPPDNTGGSGSASKLVPSSDSRGGGRQQMNDMGLLPRPSMHSNHFGDRGSSTGIPRMHMEHDSSMKVLASSRRLLHVLGVL